MNALTDNVIALVAPEQPGAEVAKPLLTMDPKAYVAAVFAPLRRRLEQATIDSDALGPVDLNTTAGVNLYTEHRATWRTIRLDAAATHKDRKAPVLEIGRLLDGGKKDIEAKVEPYETRFDAAIKAQENKKEAEKAERVRIAQEKEDAIVARIDAIRAAPGLALGQSSGSIRTILATLQAVEIDATYDDYIELASKAKNDAIATLTVALHAAEQAEQDRAELEQLRREKAAAAPAPSGDAARPTISVRPMPAFAEDPGTDTITVVSPAPPPNREPTRSLTAATPAERITDLTDALLDCHGYLTSRHDDLAGAIQHAERALLAAGITRDQLTWG